MAFPPAVIRANLDAYIARKDAERGRPLTDAERLENLRKWLAEPVEQSSDEIEDGDFCGWIDEGREG